MTTRVPHYVCLVAHGRDDLLERLERFFAADPDVRVVVDRRVGQRQRRGGNSALVGWERRLAGRRRQPEVDARLKKYGWALVRLPWPRAGSRSV